MRVIVEVGSWEHECCGEAIERDAPVDLTCLRRRDDEGQITLTETHHDLEPDVRILGRVRNIHVIRAGRWLEPVLRVPSGRALRGVDPDDDGHLETPWTGEPLAGGGDFLVEVHTTQPWPQPARPEMPSRSNCVHRRPS